MLDRDFVATNGINIERHSDGKRVRLTFLGDEDKALAVVLPVSGLPQLAAAVQSEIGTGLIVPIDRNSLKIGRPYSVQGFQVQYRQDGSARLTIFENLHDQGRTVTHALELAAQDVTDLIAHLKRDSSGSKP
jgi:hypothetical protein